MKAKLSTQNLLLFFPLLEFLGASFSQQPNIVFFLTDDQDSELDSLSAMPKLLSLIGDRGANFVNSYVATPLCCPSRSGILTGQYVHNHGAINNSLSGGCSSLEWQNGPEKNVFPTLLNNAGYTTFFAGKYLNQYGTNPVGGTAHVPPGWDSWIGLKGNSVYYNYTLSVNGTSVFHGDDPQQDYLTNVIKNEGVKFIGSLAQSTPFFMMLSTPACHAPFTPEPKYENSFNSSSIPVTPNFNIANENKNWLVQLGEQPLRQGILDQIEDIYRNRLRTLMSVDDMVSDIIQALTDKNLLDNTFLFYTSDHGYHLGQFSLTKDKREPYEFDIKVPLLVRGPGIAEGIQIDEVAINIDLAPTFLDLAGITIPENIDGISLKNVLINATQTGSLTERSILIEHSGEGSDGLQPSCEYLGTGVAYCTPEYDCKCQDAKNNTYSCVRTLATDKSEKYCTWDDSVQFEEYYDIFLDPYEITNSIGSLNITQYNDIKSKLDALLSCSGSTC